MKKRTALLFFAFTLIGCSIGENTNSQTYNKKDLFEVIWRNYDGSVLETDKDCPRGTIPVYNGTTPTKTEDEDYTYSFSHWNPTPSPLFNDTTFTAVFDSSKKEKIIEINTPNDFLNIKENLSGSYSLKFDLDFENAEWIPIGDLQNPFTGKLYGNNHTINNLTISAYGECIGLFGACLNATIDNLSVKNFNCLLSTPVANATTYVGTVSGSAENCIFRNILTSMNNVSVTKRGVGYMPVGGIVGYGSGSFINCTNYDNVGEKESPAYGIGGIVGYFEDGEINNCINYGNIASSQTTYTYPDRDGVGGIVGTSINRIKISNCKNYGVIDTSLSRNENNGTGGIVGVNRASSSTVDNCYNFGNVASKTFCGGIVGQFDSLVSNCFNSGSISSARSCGGIVGMGTCDIKKCHNAGDISCGDAGYDSSSGGIIGCVSYESEIEQCLNSGYISGSKGYSGGILGLFRYCDGNILIINCANIGRCGSNVAGVFSGTTDRVGDVTIENCFCFSSFDGFGWGVIYNCDYFTIKNCFVEPVSSSDISKFSPLYGDCTGDCDCINNYSTIDSTQTIFVSERAPVLFEQTLGWDPSIWDFDVLSSSEINESPIKNVLFGS